MEENTLDFNFWPSFSDLMLILVLILVIVVFAVIVSFSVKPVPIPPDPPGTHDLSEVKKKQEAMIKAIADKYDVKWEDVEKRKDEETETNSFVIPITLEDGSSTEISIQNDTKLQRYSFSDSILFEKNKFNLNEKGQETLEIVGYEIKKHLNNISEIQIQGHADPDKPKFDPHFNLHLAADRAIVVFIFLQEKIGIDPARHLMSATSFGEYKPVKRSDKDRTYTTEKLKGHNETKDMKDKNRRMEILLFYHFEQSNPQKDE